MSKVFFPKLAVTSLKKNKATYLPFLISSSLTVFCYYVMANIASHPGLRKVRGGDSLVQMMGFGTIVIAIFAAIFLFYTNSFLIKRRKHELGLYSILGLGKRHLARLMLCESFILYAITMVCGVGAGALLGKLLFWIVLKLSNLSATFTIGFGVEAFVQSLVLFGAIFLVLLIHNVLSVELANPIDTLRGGNKGEKQPKSSWIITVLGVLFLGGGYFIALYVKNPIDALLYFMFAVILVIFGTYCLFVSGSQFVLKLLKKNKNFYYKSRNFISVSGMMYRMKQNAAGLATIAILSTMVLVTVGSTVSLFCGSDGVIKDMNPYQFNMSYRIQNNEYPKVLKSVNQNLARHGVKMTKENTLISCNFAITRDGSHLAKYNQSGVTSGVAILDAAEYTRETGKKVELAPDEILIYNTKQDLVGSSVSLGDKSYKAVGKMEQYAPYARQFPFFNDFTIVVMDTSKTVHASLIELMGKDRSPELYDPQGITRFNVTGTKTDTEWIAIEDDMSDKVAKETGFEVIMGSLYSTRADYLTMHGSFMALGLFLGAMFTMAAVLIIYYKQITEGYDDHDRFVILQKVGMDHKEVKATIHKQIMMVFFLPLLVCIVHVAFAFKSLTKILSMFYLSNVGLIALCFGATILVYALVYAIVYAITSKTYYKLVE